MQKLISQSWARFVPLLLVLVLAACGTDNPEVNLSISDDPTVGEPITVTASSTNFTDSTTVAYTFEITAPAGVTAPTLDTSGGNTAVFTATEAGSYTISATGTSGEESDTAEATIEVEAAGGTDGDEPTATLTFTPPTPAANESVTLTATGENFSDDATLNYDFTVTGPDGSDVEVTETETESTATFTPSMDGTYTATVTIENADDGSETDTSDSVSIVVGGDGTTTGPTPATQLSADPTALAVDESTTLTALSSDFDGDVTYNFAVEDSDGTAVTEGEVVPGTGDADNTAVFTPTEAGTYTATVTVADADDASVEATSNEVTIDVAADAASVTPGDADVILSANPTSVELGGGDDEVSLTTAISNFGDETVTYAYDVTAPEGADEVSIGSTDSTASFTPTAAGDYTVTVTATGGTNAPTDEVTITVTEEPDTGNGGMTTVTSFGVANSQTGPFLNDGEDGTNANGISNENDPRVVQIDASASESFYVQVAASSPDGVSSIGIQLRNVDTDNDGSNNVTLLEQGTDVQGFTLGVPDCDLSTSPQDVTCVYEVTVSATADETNLTDDGNPDTDPEFAYVFRPTVNDQEFGGFGNRGYVNTAVTN